MSEPTAKVEQVFYDRDGVRVTSARFQVGAQTYAMNAVSSVAYQKREAETGGGWGLLAVGSALLFFDLLALAVMTFSLGIVLFGLGALAMIGGGWSIVRSAKPTFIVALTTASGQSTALSSPDREYVESVVHALNESLVSRG